jgi:lysophospholipase L1-like esterase
MRAEFEASGNGAGAGYVGFAWDQVNANNTQAHKNIDIDVLVSYSGAITSTYKGSPLPDLGYVTATTIGDKISVTLPATDNSNAATLWSPGSSGNVRYRWKNGAWTAVDLSAAGLLVKDLVGITPGGGLLEIEATSANAKIGGVRFTGDGAGVRIEKFGVSGSTIPDFLAVDAEQWQLGMEKIGPRTVQIMFFTNDRVISTPAEFGANMTQLVGRIRTAAPYADIEIVMPPENDVGGTYPQSQYAAAARRVAYALGCAFIDLQYVFGGHPDTYDWASPQKLLGSDGAHPTQHAGGYRIVGAVLRMELGRP